MNILHIINNFQRGGGAEAMLDKLARRSQTSGVRTSILSLMVKSETPFDIESSGIDVTYLGQKRSLVPGLNVIAKLRRAVKAANPDVIQGWMYHSNIVALFAKTFASKADVFWNVRHSLYDIQDEALRTRCAIRVGATLSRRPKRIVYNSTKSKTQHEKFGFNRERGIYIPNGFDCDRYQCSPGDRDEIGRELGIEQDQTIVGMIARVHPMKDHANFLAAARIVARNFPNVVFVLAGEGVRAEHPDIARCLPDDFSNAFRFLGNRKDVPKIMSALDLCVLSSTTEGFPNVLGEAMACETPCVATNVGSAAEIVCETGVMVPRSDSEALADGISQMLRMPADELRQLGRLARKRIVDNYSLDVITEKYLEMYSGSTASVALQPVATL